MKSVQENNINKKPARTASRKHLSSAQIHNPALSQLELLASICDELKIDYDSDNATLKTLTDVIKKHLESNNSAGGHTILIIDEAQLLAPDVLEQLRLLTNIETDHKKLLQIVLVGTARATGAFKRTELRQLAQRITARYHLLPLTEGQVFAYVNIVCLKRELNKPCSQVMR